jgi:hypothetical protein
LTPTSAPPARRARRRRGAGRVIAPGAPALAALGAGAWVDLRVRLAHQARAPLGVRGARALTAALRCAPALRALHLHRVGESAAAAAALARAAGADALGQLESLTITEAELAPAVLRALVAAGLRLEELDAGFNTSLGSAGAAALLAAPALALRRLCLRDCGLGAADFLALARADWPLEELDLAKNEEAGGAEAGPALRALARRGRLRRLDLALCLLGAAGFKALAEAAWPALTHLNAAFSDAEFHGPHALTVAFAGFTALEELDLTGVELGPAGALPPAGAGRASRASSFDARTSRTPGWHI